MISRKKLAIVLVVFYLFVVPKFNNTFAQGSCSCSLNGASCAANPSNQCTSGYGPACVQNGNTCNCVCAPTAPFILTPGQSCNQACTNYGGCQSVGNVRSLDLNYDANNAKKVSKVNGACSNNVNSSCSDVMQNLASQCYARNAEWTYCKCRLAPPASPSPSPSSSPLPSASPSVSPSPSPSVSPLPPPFNSSITKNPDTVKKYDMIEFTFTLSVVFTNPYDPNQVSIEANFTSPSGKKTTSYGFYFEPYKIISSGTDLTFAANGSPSWKIRFTPLEEGNYTGIVKVSSTAANATAALPNFHVDPADINNPGFVKVSNSGKYLRFDNGQFFFPQGQNLLPSWHQGAVYNGNNTTEYDMTMQELAKNGGRAIRIIASCNNAALRWKNNSACLGDVTSGFNGLNNINQLSAAKIDDMVKIAKNNNLYINFLLQGGGSVDQTLSDAEEWGDSPYNSANGGPAANTYDFFTKPEARRLYKQELRYFLSRWGYSPNIMTIELMQEMDWLFLHMEHVSTSYRDQVMNAALKSSPLPSFNPYTGWAQEMVSYLHSLDPNQHLVNISSGEGITYIVDWAAPHNLFINGAYNAGPFDLAEQHVYLNSNIPSGTDNISGVKALAEAIQARIAKPFIMAEWGLQTNCDHDAYDISGIGYHNALWTLMMRGVATWPWCALPRNTKANYLKSLPAAGAFLADENFEQDFSNLSANANVTSTNTNITTLGLTNTQKALLWVHNGQSIEPSLPSYPWPSPIPPASTPPSRSGIVISLNNMINDNYIVEFWDTWGTGGKLSQTNVVATSGTLNINLPNFNRDIAIKVNRAGGLGIQSLPSPCPADLSADKVVNLADINILIVKFGNLCQGCPEDLNKDGLVNIGDINFILGYWGQRCN